MKRQMKASAVAVLISGCLLALSAGAANGAKSAATVESKMTAACFDCTTKTEKAMAACTQGCPINDPSKKDAAVKCLSKCSDKYHASQATCATSCPKQSDARARTPDPSSVH